MAEMMPEAQTEKLSMRYERKFSETGLDKQSVVMLIKSHPAMFSEIYYERFVNNIYFDTFDMKNYFENVDGLQNRKKYRIRWYGDILGNIDRPVLEIKIKDGLLGRKESFALNPFGFENGFGSSYIKKSVERSEIPDTVKLELLSLEPVLSNRYSRKYFISSDKTYRVTVDSELEFFSLNRMNNTFMNKHFDRNNIIVELKYETDADNKADNISTYFPFRMTKSSKYVSCVEKLNLF